jgi:hypothetical protein
MEPVVQDEIGAGETGHVALRRLVEVRIDARAHEARDLDPISADPTRAVGDHADRRHHPELRPRSSRPPGVAGRRAARERRDDGERAGQERMSAGVRPMKLFPIHGSSWNAIHAR